jgi:hypothetical protein
MTVLEPKRYYREPDMDAITQAMHDRRTAKILIEEAENLNTAANEILSRELMYVPEFTHTIKGLGNACIVTKLQPSFSQAKLREYVAERYGADVVATIMKVCTDRTPVQYVQFNLERAGKGEGRKEGGGE